MNKPETINQHKDVKGLRIQFKGIEGTMEQVSAKQETYYTHNIRYYTETYYEIEILTDDMFTVKISPIAKGTLKEMYRANKIIKEYELNNGLRII